MGLPITLIPVFLFGTGTFFLIRLRGFCFARPVRYLSLLRAGKGGQGSSGAHSGKGVSPVRALLMALAGTLGVGNIAGVASALALGGPGAVFWMIVSALAAMVLKYAEILLAVRHRRTLPDGSPSGGAPYYITDALAARGHAKAGNCLALLFASLCVLNALTMGSLLQVNAAAGAMQGAFGVPPLLTGGVLAFLAAAVMLGGTRRISSLTEKLVPLMALVFLALSLAVLWLRRDRIPSALLSVVRGAFERRPLTSPAAGSTGFLPSLRAVCGGACGFLTSTALRAGVMRGLVSNEAGCGTAPMAHATAEDARPVRQGLLGVCEVFVDTVLLCTITALTILVSDSGTAALRDESIRSAQAAFTSVLGAWSGGAFAVCVLLFAAATIFCWSHYGLTCLRYIFPQSKTIAPRAFLLTYAASVVLGSVAAPSLCWQLADAALAGMTLLNLSILLLSHKEIEEETEKALKIPLSTLSKANECGIMEPDPGRDNNGRNDSP